MKFHKKVYIILVHSCNKWLFHPFGQNNKNAILSHIIIQSNMWFLFVVMVCLFTRLSIMMDSCSIYWYVYGWLTAYCFLIWCNVYLFGWLRSPYTDQNCHVHSFSWLHLQKTSESLRSCPFYTIITLTYIDKQFSLFNCKHLHSIFIIPTKIHQ